MIRIGQGYDVHKLTTGRKLILGGTVIPHNQGLLGHSDADVLTHAVMDALLGAAGLGDIGMHFPDNDPKYQDADSLLLLTEVGALLREAGFRTGNIDATVVAQAPKLGAYRQDMRRNLAAALGLPPELVNVKFTTEEGLGFTGRGEGMAAHAAALIEEI